VKLAFIMPGRSSSGGVRCISIVAQRLQDRGHQVRLLYRRPEMGVRDWARVIQSKMLYRAAPDWIERFDGPVDDFENLSCCRFDPEEILVAVGMAECAQLACVSTLQNPKVQYLHGSTPWAPELVEKALSLPIPKIVVASYLRDLVETQGHAEEVLAVVHNGVDPSEYFCSTPDSEKNGVGTIYGSHPVKDPESILRVLDRLGESKPAVPVRVFSTDRRPGQIDSKSYWRHPPLSRAREIYSRSLVWIVASRSEGFSLPVLEAMACGCVVVATDCGGPRDIIENGLNGFLVPVGDADAIVDRVQLLLTDAALRRQMRIRGEETIRHFTWDKCVIELERALEQVVRAHNQWAAERRA
jgi:glycosyltransferase involved in cell wall biosynthesis